MWWLRLVELLILAAGLIRMQGVWKIVSWARGSGNDEEASKCADDSDVPSPGSKYSSSSISFSSPVSVPQDGAEEFEDSYGPAESETDVSTSLQLRRANTPGGFHSSQWADDYSSQASYTRLEEPEEDPLHQQFRDFLLSQQVAAGLRRESGAHKSESYASSRKIGSRTIQSADGTYSPLPWITSLSMLFFILTVWSIRIFSITLQPTGECMKGEEFRSFGYTETKFKEWFGGLLLNIDLEQRFLYILASLALYMKNLSLRIPDSRLKLSGPIRSHSQNFKITYLLAVILTLECLHLSH